MEFLSLEDNSSCTSNFGVDGKWDTDLPNRFSNFWISESGAGSDVEGMLGGLCLVGFGARMNGKLGKVACPVKEKGVLLLRLLDED